MGITDLMTSLAVIFAVLLVAFANHPRPPEARPAAPPEEPPISIVTRDEPVRATLARHSPDGVAVETDQVDPRVLRVVIPESLLNFESGRSTLTAPAERFVATVVPSYAAMLCGDLRDEVEGVVIEGHTDDLGGDALNLRLSQERSLSVLIRALDAIREAAPEAYDCFSQLASASGRGKQDLVYDDEQHPDRELSRRVVLKILLRGDAPALNRPS